MSSGVAILVLHQVLSGEPQLHQGGPQLHVQGEEEAAHNNPTSHFVPMCTHVCCDQSIWVGMILSSSEVGS